MEKISEMFDKLSRATEISAQEMSSVTQGFVQLAVLLEAKRQEACMLYKEEIMAPKKPAPKPKEVISITVTDPTVYAPPRGWGDNSSRVMDVQYPTLNEALDRFKKLTQDGFDRLKVKVNGDIILESSKRARSKNYLCSLGALVRTRHFRDEVICDV